MTGAGPYLEVGCGPGLWLSRYARRHPDRLVLGLDADAAVLPDHPPGWSPLCGDLARLPLREASVHAIIARAHRSGAASRAAQRTRPGLLSQALNALGLHTRGPLIVGTGTFATPPWVPETYESETFALHALKPSARPQDSGPYAAG